MSKKRITVTVSAEKIFNINKALIDSEDEGVTSPWVMLTVEHDSKNLNGSVTKAEVMGSIETEYISGNIL